MTPRGFRIGWCLSLQKKKKVVVEIDFGWIFVCILLLFNSVLFFLFDL
jgi:hypothetical protein